MEKILATALPQWYGRQLFVYQDDIYWASNDWDEYLQLSQDVLRALLDSGAHLKPDKLFLGYLELTILGSSISHSGVKPGPEHLEASRILPDSASDRTGVKSILGFYEHYRKHFQNFSSLVAPLTELTRDKVPFVWEPKQPRSCESSSA